MTGWEPFPLVFCQIGVAAIASASLKWVCLKLKIPKQIRENGFQSYGYFRHAFLARLSKSLVEGGCSFVARFHPFWMGAYRRLACNFCLDRMAFHLFQSNLVGKPVSFRDLDFIGCGCVDCCSSAQYSRRFLAIANHSRTPEKP